MKRQRLVAAVLALAITPLASAHQDRMLWLWPGGFVVGLPWEYFSQFRLDIEQLGTAQLRVATRVGGQVTTLLPCASTHIRSLERDDVVLSGSWYHDESNLPYYVAVRFTDPSGPADRFRRSSITFLFDLRTGALIDAYRQGWKAPDWSETTNPFANDCKLAITEARPDNALERSRDQ